jgi:hypothetical protein
LVDLYASQLKQRLDLISELLHEVQALLKDLKKGTIAEIQGNPSTCCQVLDFVNVAHLNDKVVYGMKSNEEMLLAHLIKLLKVGHDRLELGVVEPSHLDDFGEQNNHHIEHLLLAVGALIGQKVEEVILDAHFFLHRDLLPVHCEQLLEGRSRQILRVHRCRVFQEVSEFRQVLGTLREIFQCEVGLVFVVA